MPPEDGTPRTNEQVDGRETPLEPALDTSVGKAFALLKAFDRSQSAGVSELARRAGIHKATAFRLLVLLQDAGLVEKDGKRYRLGAALFELGNLVGFASPESLRDLAHPYLEELYELTHLTIHLAVLDNGDVMYVDKLYGHNAVSSPSRVGGRAPAHCTALGKSLLAFADNGVLRSVLSKPLEPRTRYTITLPRVFLEELARVRQRGVAFDREETSLGLTCVSAPIIGEGGFAVAAVSVSGPAVHFDEARFEAAIRRAAAGIARAYNTGRPANRP